MKRVITIAGGMLMAIPAAAQGATATRSLGDEIARTATWFAVAIVTFVIAFKIVDLTTPGDLKQQLVDGNVAMAVYVGALAISLAIIIAALVG